MSARLAIIIVNYNTRDWLSQCLRSLYAQDMAQEVEIVVVDSASTDDSVDMVRRDFPCYTLIASKENLGFGRGNNLGAARITAPILLFLNPDTRVTDGALAELLLFMDQHPQYGAAGGRIYDGEGQQELSAGTWPTLLSLILDRVLVSFPSLCGRLEHLAHHYWEYEKQREVGWVTGAYLCIRRDLFEQLSGFDPAIFMYYEDVELCYRVWASGSRVCYFPGASIIHYRNKAPVLPRHRKRRIREGLRQFARKHYAWGHHGTTRWTAELLHCLNLWRDKLMRRD